MLFISLHSCKREKDWDIGKNIPKYFSVDYQRINHWRQRKRFPFDILDILDIEHTMQHHYK